VEANRDTKKNFTMGIGAGISGGPNDTFEMVTAAINWTGVLEPLRIALETFYSNAKAPAVAVGLGHLFGDQQRVSGKAKEFEWRPTIQHALEKQPSFTRGITALFDTWRALAGTAPPFGQGLRVSPTAKVRVEYDSDIVPVNQAERLDTLVKEVMGGMKSLFTAMIEHNGWTPERAALELDIRLAEQNRHLADLGYKDIVKAIIESQSVTVSASARKATAKKLLTAQPPMPADTGEGGV
jgi:hypothetical protein